MTLRAVFLDIGDTVMRPNPSWEHIYGIAFGEYGIEVQMEELRAALRRAYHHGGWGMEKGFVATEESSFRRTMEIDRAALDDLGLPALPEPFFRRLSELFMLTTNWHVFPDARLALVALRQRGLVIGAVSNWVWQLPELLHSLELVSQFDFIAASARIGYEKPAPEIFQWALEQAGVEPFEALHVGDHLDADVGGATAAGIPAVLIDRHQRFLESDLAGSAPVIRSLAELVPLVDARLGVLRPA